MFQFRSLVLQLAKPFSVSRRNFQVSIIGAARPLGQTVALLLKQHPLIQRLNLIDHQEEIIGVANDVSHIPQQAAVSGWRDRIEEPLRHSDIVVVASGERRKLGQNNNELFKENAKTLIPIMQTIGCQCPNAFVVIATEPINHTVPLASKILQSKGYDNQNKILGVTGQDTMRAQCWIGELSGLRPDSITIPVICGHSSKTIVPIFSHISPKINISDTTAAILTKYLRKSEGYIADKSNNWGSYSLLSAYATSSAVSAVLNALNGVEMQHVAFVAHYHYGTEFFSTPILITREGVSGIMQYPMTSYETNLLVNATRQLAREISEGEAYFQSTSSYTEFQKLFKNAKVYF